MDPNSWTLFLPTRARLGHTGALFRGERTDVLGPDVGRVGNVCARVARRMSEGAACIGGMVRRYRLAALVRGGACAVACDK